MDISFLKTHFWGHFWTV